MATRVQLVTRAAKKLQILEAGQTLEDEDEEVLDDSIDGLFAQLAKDEICIIGDEDNLPEEWLDPLAGLLANMCSSDFGKPYSTDAKELFERQLRRMNAAKPTYEVLRTEPY